MHAFCFAWFHADCAFLSLDWTLLVSNRLPLAGTRETYRLAAHAGVHDSSERDGPQSTFTLPEDLSSRFLVTEWCDFTCAGHRADALHGVAPGARYHRSRRLPVRVCHCYTVPFDWRWLWSTARLT